MDKKQERKYVYMTICVDFDGVIAECADTLGECGRIIPKSAWALQQLRSLGYTIIIHTARPMWKESKDTLVRFLKQWEIPYDTINFHPNPNLSLAHLKPPADLYIDDRALRFEGDWEETLEKAKQLLGISEQPNYLSHKQLLGKIMKRKNEITTFEEFLKKETSWLTSPASTRFHLPTEGGLLKHSINVANTLLKLRKTLAPELSEESCVIVALYHDIGKIGMPGKPFYLPNPSKWHVINRGINYTVNQELIHMDIATRSLFLVSSRVSLSDEEAQAIRYHDGQYIEENKSVAHRESNLTRLLQYADNWSGGVLET